MSEKGNKILLAARSAFRARRAVETLQKIEVPEWDCTVYYWPEMDVAEREGVYQHFRAGAEGLQLEGAGLVNAAVMQVLLRSRDEFGNRLFGDADQAALRDTDPGVLTRISNEMGWGSRPNIEDAEKNS